MSLIKKRILNFIDEMGFNKSKFYRDTGITRGVLDKDSGLTENNIAKFIAAYPDVQLTWLLKGEGKMFKEHFSSSGAVAEPKEEYIRNLKLIPLLTVQDIRDLVENPSKSEDLISSRNYVIPEFSEADFLIRLSGDDMLPTYNSGDMVVCKLLDTSGYIQWGKAHLLLTDQGVLVRRVHPSEKEGHLLLVSDNPAFPEFDILHKSVESIALILGVIKAQ